MLNCTRTLGTGSCFLLVFVFVLLPTASHALIITGNISDWVESGPDQIIGDGTNHVTLWWSISGPDLGWFYGSAFTGDSDVAWATGVTDVSEITDASSYAFTNNSLGPACDADCAVNGVGEFMVWSNTSTGHFGVLRIDDIVGSGGDATLNGTWWFQTDGTGDFSTIPEPSTASLIALGLVGIAATRRRRAS